MKVVPGVVGGIREIPRAPGGLRDPAFTKWLDDMSKESLRNLAAEIEKKRQDEIALKVQLGSLLGGLFPRR